MKIQHLQGLIAAPFTPFDKNGKLDVSLIPGYYAFLKQNKITGAFINGSTGEGVSITLEEKKAVAQAWADCSNHDADFKVMVF
ncbi:MAG TPA: dihydrodipicolinate synthase family protein, partial [Flavobacterium sp.]|uniref:dihydrodipicolinate synthase family protein n=1 Tax=Flavobacterium sp. TaxID=239 RepID=UPI002DBCE8BF